MDKKLYDCLSSNIFYYLLLLLEYSTDSRAESTWVASPADTTPPPLSSVNNIPHCQKNFFSEPFCDTYCTVFTVHNDH